MSNPSSQSLADWYAEVADQLTRLRTVLSDPPTGFLPRDAIEAVERIEHQTLEIESDLAHVAAGVAYLRAWSGDAP